MRLLDIWIKNFMRFKSAHLELHDVGMCLIEGRNLDDESATSNGAGKSTIVDALLWCLYGVTTHEPSAQGDDVINEKRLKNCEVRVRFKVGKYQHYGVTRRRGWKKGGKSVQLELVTWDPQTQGGGAGDMTKGTVKDTQVAIEKLIGMSVATFRHACVFGQGRAYRFSRLTDSEKKAVLDEMLGSEVYAVAAQKASDQLTETERALEKAQASLETALDSLQDARKRLGRLKAKAKDAERQTQAKRDALKLKLGHAKVLLGAIEAPKTRDNALVIAETNEREAETVWRKAMRLADASRVELKRLEEKRAKVRSTTGTDCITCGQLIGEEHIDTQIAAIDEQIEKQGATDHIANEALIDAKKKYDERKAHTKQIAKDCDQAREQQRARKTLEAEVDDLRERLAELREGDRYGELIADERKHILKLRKKTERFRAFVKQHKRDAEHLRFWQHGFGTKGLRSLMLDSTLPYLNAKLDHYTNALTAGNIAVEFKAQKQLKGGGTREEFHIEVRNKHGSTKYNMNSVGERAKIDIIVGLALQDMAASRSRVPVNVAFFDEVFDGLDDRGIDRAVQVLSELQRESAFIISHKSELKTFFSKSIVVVKQNGESRLEN